VPVIDSLSLTAALRLAVSVLFVVLALVLPPTTRARAALGAALSAGLAFVWLYPRGSEDWCTYRNVFDCLKFDQCFTMGAGSSVLLTNGAVWFELMTLAGWLGPGAALPALVAALTAVAVGAVFAGVARRGSPAHAWAVAAGLVLWIGWAIDRTLLDADGTFPFAALGQAALAVFALTRRLEALAAGALLLAVAGNTHTSAVTGAAALGMVAVAGSPQPLVGGLLAAVLWLLTTAVTSDAALALNVRMIAGMRYGWALAIGILFGIVGVGLLGRRRWEAASGPARVGAVGAAVVAPQVAGTAVLIAIGHGLWTRYAMPVAAPVALGLVAAADGLAARRLPAWARPAALAALFALPLLAAPEDWGPSRMGCMDVGDQPIVREVPGVGSSHLLTDAADAMLRGLEADPSALGPAAAAFGVAADVDNAYVRVGVRHVDGHWTRFLALRPPLAGAHDAPFVTVRDRGDRDPDVDRYAAALAARLPPWPWSQGTLEFRWPLAGPTPPPTTIARVWGSLAFVAATVLFGLWVVLLS
jgi:hypothetical protein